MLLTRYQTEKTNEVGCDEVGRGCLAGPVVAAAVLLPSTYTNSEIKDSKKLSLKKRELLKDEIKKNAIAYAIGVIDVEKIDEINIRNASIAAMHKALDTVKEKIDFILVDGNFFITYKKTPHKCVIKGDNTYLSIAAASILAKTYRDKLMKKYDDKYPEYNWSKNKGYATREHVEAIKKYGLTDFHRKSFHIKELNTPLSLF